MNDSTNQGLTSPDPIEITQQDRNACWAAIADCITTEENVKQRGGFPGDINVTRLHRHFANYRLSLAEDLAPSPAVDQIALHTKAAEIRTDRAAIFAALIECREALAPIADPSITHLTADGALKVISAFEKAVILTRQPAA